MSDLRHVTDDYWAERFEDAETDHDRMGVAWSYLLANLAAGPSTPLERNKLRNRVIDFLTIEANGIWRA